jgi:hypothetical protein
MRYSALVMLLLPVQVFAEQVQGRVAGVHDGYTLLANGSGQAAPTRRKPIKDEIKALSDKGLSDKCTNKFTLLCLKGLLRGDWNIRV